MTGPGPGRTEPCPVCGSTAERSIGLSGPGFDLCGTTGPEGCYTIFHDRARKIREEVAGPGRPWPGGDLRSLDTATIEWFQRERAKAAAASSNPPGGAR